MDAISRGSVVATATDYSLDDIRGRGLSPYRPDRLWGSTHAPIRWVGESFIGGKLAVASS